MTVLFMVEVSFLALKVVPTKLALILEIVGKVNRFTVRPSLVSSSEALATDRALKAPLTLLNVLIQVFRTGNVA